MEIYVTLLSILLLKQVEHRNRITLSVPELIVVKCHVIEVAPLPHRLYLLPVKFTIILAAFLHREKPNFISTIASSPFAQTLPEEFIRDIALAFH